jgi:hypothetical protein
VEERDNKEVLAEHGIITDAGEYQKQPDDDKKLR